MKGCELSLLWFQAVHAVYASGIELECLDAFAGEDE